MASVLAPNWRSTLAIQCCAYGVTSLGSTAGMPTSGSNWLQLTVEFGFARLAPSATCCKGKRCPAFAPVAATVNGDANSGGAADV